MGLREGCHRASRCSLHLLGAGPPWGVAAPWRNLALCPRVPSQPCTGDCLARADQEEGSGHKIPSCSETGFLAGVREGHQSLWPFVSTQAGRSRSCFPRRDPQAEHWGLWLSKVAKLDSGSRGVCDCAYSWAGGAVQRHQTSVQRWWIRPSFTGTLW